MKSLDDLRHQIQTFKQPAAGQPLRQFLPNGILKNILNEEVLRAIICLPAFQIPLHKQESTVSIVLESRDGVKVTAILVDLELEHKLAAIIENGFLDQPLPIEKRQLEVALGARTHDFAQRQWEYIAHEFPSGLYQRKLRDEIIIPYTQQKVVGSGGFSSVYEVIVHPAHQRFTPNAPATGVRLIRKEITGVGPGFSQKDESELLFLLGTLKHRNIVELVAAYIHNDKPNLLLSPADLDLEHLLQQQHPYAAFRGDDPMLKAIHDLVSGLKYLHHFQYPSLEASNLSALVGVHQDIKPRNILVRGNDLQLSDFGLARLKPTLEGSRTVWKDATFEYGAPECQDPDTFEQGQIGRASDIWSLSCVLLELLIHIINGFDGIKLFRDKRLTVQQYGRTRAFHNGKSMKDEVREEIEHMQHVNKGNARARLVSLLHQCFATSPNDRPTAEVMEFCLARITIQILVDDLLEVINAWAGETSDQSVSTVFKTRLRLERYRLQAWATLSAYSDETPIHSITSSTIPKSMSKICDTLRNAIVRLKEVDSTIVDDCEEPVLSTLYQCNNELFAKLTRAERASVDTRCAILVTSKNDMGFLKRVGQVDDGGVLNSSDVGAIAAMKYMSILFSKELQHSTADPIIDQSLIELDVNHNSAPEIRPPIYWLNHGYLPGERKRVMIERRSYRGAWNKDPYDNKFREVGEVMFHRVLDLIKLLRLLSKESTEHLRVLHCVGAFHNGDEKHFGIVYDLPDGTDFSPVRLHHLLKGKGSPSAVRPHIGQKLALARALVRSIQTFHISGWVHKNINSANVLFFVASPLSDGEINTSAVDYHSPYLINFEHSRQSDPNAITEGLFALGTENKYRHPVYATGSVPFRREHDYYSLGLVLVEIAVWERLSAIYMRHPTYTLSQLRREYLAMCDKYVLERMGPIYHAATRACLTFEEKGNPGADDGSGLDSSGDVEDYDVAMHFQRDVVDRLDSCRF